MGQTHGKNAVILTYHCCSQVPTFNLLSLLSITIAAAPLAVRCQPFPLPAIHAHNGLFLPSVPVHIHRRWACIYGLFFFLLYFGLLDIVAMNFFLQTVFPPIISLVSTIIRSRAATLFGPSCLLPLLFKMCCVHSHH